MLGLTACHSSLPPRPTTTSPRPAAANPATAPRVINVVPQAEGPGNPTDGIDTSIPLETSVTPKVEPIVKGTTKPYVVNGETMTPMAAVAPFSQTGIASWYGKKFHGLKTASGEPYNMYKLTGAHKTLPIPSYVQVTNLNNQKSVIVRINDRGPFAHNRVIDLSYAAAKQLDIIGHGSTKVALTLIDPNTATTASTTAGNTVAVPASPTAAPIAPVLASVPELSEPGVYVQVGAFSKEENADRTHQRIFTALPDAHAPVNKVYNGKVFQIVLGPYPDHALASEAAGVMRDQLQLPALIFTR